MIRRLVLLLLAPLILAASQPRLVPDVSQSRIDIIYSFTGAELLRLLLPIGAWADAWGADLTPQSERS